MSNKRSIALDLADAGDRALARRLASEAVVVENFRPGVMDRHGLGYEQLGATRPGRVERRYRASAHGVTEPPATFIATYFVSR